MAALTVIRIGHRDYAEMVEVQERLAADRLESETGDLLLLLEHPPTYTLGRRSEPSDLLHGADWYRDRGIETCESPRGGKVTFHAPGQLVAYPIIDLRGVGDQPAGADRVDVAAFVTALEQAMSGALARWGLAAGSIDGLTGLWIDDDRSSPEDFSGADAESSAPGLARGSIRKIGSIGLKIRRGVTSHGLSLNVSCDLEPFEWINSCGIETCRATSMAAELKGNIPSVRVVGESVAQELTRILGRESKPGKPSEIGLDRRQRVDSVA